MTNSIHRRYVAPFSAAIASAVIAIAASGGAEAETTCTFTTSGSTLRLNGNCQTDETIPVPNGSTLDGRGFTITAVDPPNGGFQGAIVKNGGRVANVRNLKLRTQDLRDQCDEGDDVLSGVRLEGASGSITDVDVLSLNQGASGCQEGFAIDVYDFSDDAAADRRSVRVSDVSVRNFQKTAVYAGGNVRVTLTNSDLGPSATQRNLSANTVEYSFGALGNVSKNRIAGNQNLIPGGADDTSATAVIIYEAPGVTVFDNRIDENANVGVYVTNGSSRATVRQNRITDETRDGGDITQDEDFDTGIFVSSDSRSGSSVTNNVIRCYNIPVFIEGGGSGQLGSNRTERCNQQDEAGQRSARRAAAAAGGPSVGRPTKTGRR